MFEVFFALIIWACVVYMLWTIMADGIISRVSPKYAAKRRVKQNARYERLMERSRVRRGRKIDRTLEWAKRHQNDPIAKSLLSQQYDDSPEGRLRMSQQFNDEYERDRETREAAVDARNQEALEWALAHPYSPVAQRHLRESLVRARRQLNHVSQMVEHYQRMLEFDHIEQHQRDDYLDCLGDARLELEATQQSVIQIELTLGADALSEQ